jgi:hypothetical protein
MQTREPAISRRYWVYIIGCVPPPKASESVRRGAGAPGRESPGRSED